MSPTTDEQLDLLAAATHEAGHALAFRKANVRVTSVRVWHGRHGAEGVCTVDDSHIPDRLGYLAAILAGLEAHARFVEKHCGMAFLGTARRTVAGCATSDQHAFRHYARNTGISHGRARDKAQSFVWWNTGPIDRLAAKLTRKGRLTGWSL